MTHSRQQPSHLSVRDDAPAPTPSPVTFPQVARLELDELLLQLMDRAQEVLATQGRLRGLLSATQSIAGDLHLPTLLRRIVTAACGVVDARKGALRIVDADGEVAAFVGVGLDEADLGHAGPHLVGATVAVGGGDIGMLYAADKGNGRDFTDEDREVLTALAVGAGMAIRNARLFEAAERRQRWLEASAEIRRELLTEGSDPLALIVRRARELTAADFAALVVASDDEEFTITAADGDGAEALETKLPRAALPLAAAVLDGRRNLVLTDAAEAGMQLPTPRAPSGPVAAVHLDDVQGNEGALVLLRRRGAPAFGRDDLDMVSSFASHAAVAVHLEEAERGARRAAVLEDRERIAQNLHGVVIQQLFSTGLRLQSAAARSEPSIAEEISLALEELDDTIKTVRLTIFQLHDRAHAKQGWSAKLAACAQAATDGLGFEPLLEVTGAAEAFVDDDVGERLVDVLREALDNVSHHAHAHRVTVRVTASSELIELAVDDDGIGIDATAKVRRLAGGLTRMRQWAEELGGELIVTSHVNRSGTAVRWRAPVPA